MNKKVQQRKEYLIHIKDYLTRLNKLTLNQIIKNDLFTIEESENILEQSKHLLKSKFTKKFEIEFNDKKSSTFTKYITRLIESNSSKNYVWIRNTEKCGYMYPISLMDINWSYPFDFDSNGIVTFTTIDFKNKLSLDCFVDEEYNREMMEVEVFGEDWCKIDYFNHDIK